MADKTAVTVTYRQPASEAETKRVRARIQEGIVLLVQDYLQRNSEKHARPGPAAAK